MKFLHTWQLLPAALLIGAWVYLQYLYPAWRRLRAYIDKVSTCGYLAEPPTAASQRLLKAAATIGTFLQVGQIKIVGGQLPPKCAAADGSKQAFMVCPNHPHFADPAVIARVLDSPARYMAARGVFTFGYGLGALFAAPVGAFAVDLTPGKGAPARQAAIKVLTTNQVLVMFPEGWAYLDGKMGRLHKGAVGIAREAARELGMPVAIYPVFLRYGRYPGHWITRLSPRVQYLWLWLNKWHYRRGVVVVIGKPIYSNELPEDDAAGTELLRRRIVALDPQNNKQLPPSKAKGELS